MKTSLLILSCFIITHIGLSQSQPSFSIDDKAKMKKNRVLSQTKWKYRPGAKEGVKILKKAFDEEGNSIEEMNFKSDGSKSTRLTYKFDYNGNKIYYQLYDFTQDPDKKIRYIQNMKYNEHGDRISETGFDGHSEFKIIYKYKSPGKLSEIIKYNQFGVITERHNYTYSDNIALINITDQEGNIKEKQRKTYNEKDNLIEKANLSPNDDVLKLNKYKYNDNNFMIEEEEYYAGRFTYKLTYNYHANGNLTSVDKEDRDGNIFKNNTYTYDQKGNLIEEKWFDGNPDDYSKKKYGYDDNNNITEVDSYYSLYKYKVLYKYTYEYY